MLAFLILAISSIFVLTLFFLGVVLIMKLAERRYIKKMISGSIIKKMNAILNKDMIFSMIFWLGGPCAFFTMALNHIQHSAIGASICLIYAIALTWPCGMYMDRAFGYSPPLVPQEQKV